MLRQGFVFSIHVGLLRVKITLTIIKNISYQKFLLKGVRV